MATPKEIEISGPVDVLLETTNGVPHSGGPATPRITEPVELIPRLWLGQINEELGEQVMDSLQGGLNWRPQRQFGAMYALVRELTEDEVARNPFRWDEDQVIQEAVALSRWIRPTPLGFEYAARIRPDGPDGKPQIIPGEVTNLSRFALVEKARVHDRLSPSDAQALKDLMAKYGRSKNRLPPRIQRVMWNHEYVRRTYFLNVAWHLIGASFEALVNTSERNVSLQFRERVAKLGAEVGEDDMTEDRAKAIYKEIRCALAHGGDVIGLDQSKKLDDFTLSMDVLRKVLRRSVEDPQFAANFADETSIRAWRKVETPGKHGALSSW